MTTAQAVQIADFLEGYNKHFAEVADFLNLKHQKVLADDLGWLHDSLPEEQRLSMAGSSLESKRLDLMEELGCADKTSSELLEICPEEARGRIKMECANLEKALDRIKSLNADTLETIEKKLELAEEFMRRHAKQNQGQHRALAGAGFYGATGSKVRIGDPEDEIIGKM
jgi:hypothetical protein